VLPRTSGCRLQRSRYFFQHRSYGSCSSLLSFCFFLLRGIFSKFQRPQPLFPAMKCVISASIYVLENADPPELLELKPSKGFSPASEISSTMALCVKVLFLLRFLLNSKTLKGFLDFYTPCRVSAHKGAISS
jgi:hypothetical protein